MRKSKIMLKKTWKQHMAVVLTATMMVSGITVLEKQKRTQAKTVNKTGYTLSKAAGTYQNSVKIKITAKKGYQVYYSLNGTLTLKKVIKNGKSKTITINKTKTLSIYAVKSSKKIKKTTLRTNLVKQHTQTYRYTIQNTAATASPTASAEAEVQTATPSASAEATATATSPSVSSDTTEVSTGQVIDLSSTDGKKISASDTGYTYKKSKKNKIQILAPGTYTITGNGGTYDGLIIVDFGEKYDTDGDDKDDTSYETSKGAEAGSVHIILDNITLTDTNADFDINTASEMTSDDGLLKIKSSDYLTNVELTIQNQVTLNDTGVTGTAKDDATNITYPAAILSKKTPLVINGNGTLTVSSKNGNGIKSTSSLLIENVTVQAGASGSCLGHNGITAKTTLETKNSDITIYSKKDGLKTTYDSSDVSDTTSPYEPVLTVTGGALLIETEDGDGISASYTLNEGTTSEASYGKAVLSPESIYIKTKAANANSNTADDAIHANGDVMIEGGNMTLSAADGGIHADGTLTIQDGTITVSTSYEGLEGNDIVISGGTMNITASDDGLNAAGGSDSGSSSQDSFIGNPFGNRSDDTTQNQTGNDSSSGSYKGIKAGSSLTIKSGNITIDTLSTGTKSNTMDNFMMNMSDTNHSLTITGGTLTVFTEGDGLDSNGNLYIKGGNIVVYGPSNGGNGSIDIGDGGGCVFEITGGTLWAFAGTSDMAVTPTSADPAYVSFTMGTVSAGKTVAIQNQASESIDSITLQKAAAHVTYYGKKLTSGSTYSISSENSTLASAEATNVSSGNNGMPGGNFGPGGNGAPDGNFGPGGNGAPNGNFGPR